MPNTTIDTQNASTQRLQFFLVACLMGLPFLTYLVVINRYFVNVPYWDDFSVVLAQVNKVFATYNLGDQIQAIFTPNAGHLPAITRLISILQVKYLGGIDFKASLIAANMGWLLTTALLLFYFRRTLSLSWIALLPIPFLMLNINHWEAMDFITPAWQMYWGSAFFPALCFIAIVEKRVTIAIYAFVGALFLSSGALPLYPLVIGYCLVRRRWQDTVDFALRAGMPLLIFFYFNPPSGSASKAPDLILMLKYIPAFMGNLVSTGTWDMTPIAWIQIPLGIIIIGLGARVLLKSSNGDLSKLIFIYVMILGGMAAYLRGEGFAYIVSRYALFASLAATCLYAVYAKDIQGVSKNAKWFFPAASAIAALLWVHSMYICRTPLQLNMNQHLNGIEAYLNPTEPAENYLPLVWDIAYGRPVMDEAKTWGVYNPEVMRKTP